MKRSQPFHNHPALHRDGEVQLMPAYRSSAEAEVRDAVVARLRQWRPDARIIHEISNGGSNRIDVLAVSPAEIIGIEVKSAKDTLERLDNQLRGIFSVAHHSIAAIHESLIKDGERPVSYPTELWRFPEPQEPWSARWRMPRMALQAVLPPSALQMVWKNELLAICERMRISATSRTTCETMRRDILWHCTGQELTTNICAELRARECPEADPPILVAGKLSVHVPELLNACRARHTHHSLYRLW